jgi:two-component system, sensor histidine kinase
MLSRETQALMDAAVDAVIVIDHRGRMLAVNDSTRRVFGFRTDELLGQNVSMLMPEPDRGAHDEYLQRYLRTGVAKIIGLGREVSAQRSDGTVFPARLSVGRIPDSDPPRFVGLVRDTTSEHEATAALKARAGPRQCLSGAERSDPAVARSRPADTRIECSRQPAPRDSRGRSEWPRLAGILQWRIGA